MRLILLVVLIVFPLAELAILIKLGSIFGFWPTFGLVVLTAILGTTILHRQGFEVLKRTEEAISLGRPPIGPVVDGVLLLAAGLLLITPGLIADTAGLLLLIPPVRRWIAHSAFKRVLGPFMPDAQKTKPNQQREAASPRSAGQKGQLGPNQDRRAQGPVIDADFEQID